MRKLILIVLGIMALGAVPAQAAGKDCGYVVLEPYSDYSDYNIRANIQCDRAIAVAVRWSVEAHAGAYGFRCRWHGVDQGLYHTDVRCTRGSRFVTFSAS